MPLEQELAVQSSEKDTVLTIGVFDGVHAGHKHLLDKVKEQAKKLGALSAVVTFSQHPEELISPGKEMPYLTSLSERISRLKKHGIDLVIVLSFNQELANIAADEFIRLLIKYLRVRAFIIGPDFACGKNRMGDAEFRKKVGYTVTVVQPKIMKGEVISSTLIRQALALGDMQRVRNLAGHYFSLAGPVVTGFGRGKVLGFPTANIDVDKKQALPPDGVYATIAYIDERKYFALSNIGVRPTFENGQRSIEVFLLDYEGNLYGKEMKIELVERLRPEIKFASADDLKKQINEDIKKGKEILNYQINDP
jgi:riboflavin kinase / FMN adenylyltransferase